MKFKTFYEMLRYAMLSRNFNEFTENARKVEGYTEDIAATGILFSIWLFSVDHTCKKLRELTGWTRAKFCREYNLPVRTVENWDLRRTEPTANIIDLLAFAVLSDLHSVPDMKTVMDIRKEVEAEAK